jgi:hypothetical protein
MRILCMVILHKIQETVDSLEMVRQLFEAGVCNRVLASICHDAHSPVGMHPEIWCSQRD